MSPFVQVDRQRLYLLPPSVQDRLPEDHLALDGTQVKANASRRSARSHGHAPGREAHHADPMQRFGPEPLGPAPQEPMQAMAHRLRTHDGRALHALRKRTVEPVIGITINSVVKFRQFLRRGLDKVAGG